MDDETAREKLATGTRILARHEMIGMFGHISQLTEDPTRYLLCPGAGLRKDRVRPQDVLDLGLDDEFAPGRPLELYMHAAMHRAHPEITSLVHVHSPNLTALSVMAEPPSELLMIHAGFWPDRIPVWDRPELVTSHAMADEMVELMGTESVCLLRGHGAVIIGRTIEEAVFRTTLAEYHAGLVLASLAHGRELAPITADRAELGPRVLPPATHAMNWRYESTFVELPDA